MHARNPYIYIIILSLLTPALSEAQVAQVAAEAAPRLVVSIAIDQLRSEDMERYMPFYGGDGFRKLLAKGLVFSRAAYPMAVVDRASASATLSSGCAPTRHGIVSGEWVSRKTLAPMAATTDETSVLAPRNAVEGAWNMLASTVGDELKMSTSGLARVYGIAPQADGAIMLAGHAADAALWIDQRTGLWTTSTFYQRQLPEWLSAYNRTNTAERKEKSTTYTLTGPGRHALFTRTPLVNADVTALALQCVAAAGLGADATPDLLCLQYYAGQPTDASTSESQSTKRAIVRRTTPGSTTATATQPVSLQDTYTRLDAALSRLITGIEQRLGADNVLFVVTTTGYSDAPQHDLQAYRVPTGTVYINRTASLLNMYLSALYGQERYVEAYHDTEIYLDHKLLEQKKLRLAEVVERSREMLVLSDGIAAVHTLYSLTANTTAQTAPLAAGYHPRRSGDIVLETAPGWRVLNEDNHRSRPERLTAAAFPIIIYGPDVKHETIAEPVSAVRVAPTLSRALRIRAPNGCQAEPLQQ